MNYKSPCMTVSTCLFCLKRPDFSRKPLSCFPYIHKFNLVCLERSGFPSSAWVMPYLFPNSAVGTLLTKTLQRDKTVGTAWDLINHVITLFFGENEGAGCSCCPMQIWGREKWGAWGKQLDFGAASLNSNPCPLFSLRNDHLSLSLVLVQI